MIRIISYVLLMVLTAKSATAMEMAIETVIAGMKNGLTLTFQNTFRTPYEQLYNPAVLKSPEILSEDDIPEPPELVCLDIPFIIHMKGSFIDTQDMLWGNNTKSLTNCLESPIFNENIKNRSGKNMTHLPLFLATKYPLLTYHHDHLSFRVDYWLPFPIQNHKPNDISLSFYQILSKKKSIRFSSFLKESGITMEKGGAYALLKESEEDFKVRLQNWQDSYKLMREIAAPESLQSKIKNSTLLKSYEKV